MSNIEWTDQTWNPIVGCSVVSPGCTNGYAMRMAGTRLKNNANYRGLTRDSKAGPVWTGEVRLLEERLAQPLKWRKPRRVFVNSMSDLFHEDVADDWIDRVFAVMALAPQHVFQVLTKRPERMREYMAGIDDNDGGRIEGMRDALIEGNAQKIYADRTGEDPSMWLAVNLPLPNVWLGTSVEDQARADQRIPALLETPAAIRFLSCEPLLGEVDLSRVGLWLCKHWKNKDSLPHAPWCPDDASKWWWKPQALRGPGQIKLDWVICGGESGPGARDMDPAWARSLRDQCASAGTAYFMKQMTSKFPIPGDLMVREYPST